MPEMYAQVTLPLPLHDAYTYRVPEHLQQSIGAGQRVVVQFGVKKYYAALVLSLSNHHPGQIKTKEIIQILDEEPVVLPKNLELWKWMAGYYCAALGDIFKAALPSGLKLESKSTVSLTGSEEALLLTEKEYLLIDLLNSDELTLDELQKRAGNRFSYTAFKSLLEKNVIRVDEQFNTKYQPKTETQIRIHPKVNTLDALHEAIISLKKAKKQEALMLFLLEQLNDETPLHKNHWPKKKILNSTGCSETALKGLIDKKILQPFRQPLSRIEEKEGQQAELTLLNSDQQRALTEIKNCFQKDQVALIHGITASGKTEIYIHLMDEMIKKGRQVLYLLPEIALTTQIIQRLKSVFGSKAGIYHSRLNSQERVEIWRRVLTFRTSPEKGYQIVLGARSALFLPFADLGLVVVDEEHENSYKQFDPTPRYHARDMAVVLAKQHHAHIVLGTATPSLESYHNTQNGKYGLVSLTKRHSELELPEMIIADVGRAEKKKQMTSVLTPELFQHIEEALKNHEQVILFQNRRGYAPYVRCNACGWIPKCKNCDVSLTYHKFNARLNCHYCGYSMALPEMCHECGSPGVATRGFGTEKIEDELKILFPGTAIARMDLDTTRSANAFEKIIRNLELRKTDILIGTQMVTKGLNFEHVRVVGIVDADSLINFPDFRAHERAFQLISQVSGRAGRKHHRGKVVIQTTQPNHPIFQLILHQDYQTFYREQMSERELFRYPPQYRLIKLTVKHKNPETVDRAANLLAQQVKKNRLLLVLGPEYPLVSRIQLWYQKEIWLKMNPKAPLNQLKTDILNQIDFVKRQKENSGCLINIDVDPA